MGMTEIASGLKFPEGPVAMADGSIILTEIAGGVISRIRPDGKKQTVSKPGGGPNGAAIGPDGALYVTNNGGSFHFHKRMGLMFPGPRPADHTGGRIERIDLSTGKAEPLYTECEGMPLVGPNDIVFDGEGGFWFTDHGAGDAVTRKLGGLYYARADGSKIVRAIGSLLSPNGVGLSPDGARVMWADTLSGRLFKADIAKPGTGKLKPGTGLVPGDYVGSGPGYCFFDSLAVQADGGVCVATILNSGITTISQSGKAVLTAIPGDPLITNICFGGKGLKTAYITLSGTGKLVSMPWRKAGLRLAHEA
ncbi:MAG: SMP-30/gluconolactonase/LRE family protein [Alphaproteobacteria bacterium]|nr:SMP-30/gluconolactonase/LRE family protein [Alphaproteobacteria bacterium]